MRRFIIGLALVGMLCGLGRAAEADKTITNFGSNATGTAWKVFIRNNSGSGNVDWIQLVNSNWTEVYIMSQADVSPTAFAATYNAIRDAIINRDVVALVVTYESTHAANNRRLYRVSTLPR